MGQVWYLIVSTPDLCRLSYFVFVMISRLFIAALWSPTWKGLASWLSFVMFNCVFVLSPCGILGQMWYLILSIPDLCRLSYFVFVMLPRLFVVALWSPAGKGPTPWPLFVMFNCFSFPLSPCGILGQVWYLIASTPDLAAFLTFLVSIPIFNMYLNRKTSAQFENQASDVMCSFIYEKVPFY